MSGEVAFACEISEDRRKAAVVASGREQDGTRVVVDLVWYDHPRGAVGRLVVDQSPLVAATLSVWAFLRWEELATPGVWAV